MSHLRMAMKALAVERAARGNVMRAGARERHPADEEIEERNDALRFAAGSKFNCIER